MNPEQAAQLADNVMEEARRDLEEKRQARDRANARERSRRDSPAVPAFTAALTVWLAMQYIDNGVACVILGAAVGAAFGWAARRS